MAQNITAKAPNSQDPNSKKSRPFILDTLETRLFNALDKHHLPTFEFSHGRQRRVRTERREAAKRVLRVLISRLDLATLHFLHFDGKHYSHFLLRELPRLTGLSPRRCKRVIADLKAAGLILIKPFREKRYGQYRSRTAHKGFSMALFKALGIDRTVKKAQIYAQRLRKRAAKAETKAQEFRTEAQKGRDGLGRVSVSQAMQDAFGNARKPKKRPNTKEAVDQRKHHATVKRQAELIADNPTLTMAQLKALLS